MKVENNCLFFVYFHNLSESVPEFTIDDMTVTSGPLSRVV